MPDAWRPSLAAWLAPPWAIVTMGNPLRGDDGVAERVVDWLRGCPFPCLRGGTAPENLCGPLRAMGLRRILLVDAVDFGAEPGDIRLFTAADLGERDISTHGMSPSLFLQFLRAETGAEVRLLGIQPASCALGASLSAACARAAARVAAALARLASRPGHVAA